MRLLRSALVVPPALLLLAASAARADFAVTAATATSSSSTGGPSAPVAGHTTGVSSFGDHAASVLSFDRDAGRATVSTHACAAPQTLSDPAGIASAGAYHAQVTFAYQITSSTLPVGTPVTIQLCVAASRSMAATYVPPLGSPPLNDYADSGLNLSLAIAGHLFSGTAHELAYYQSPPSASTFTGIFLETLDDDTVTVERAVGDYVSLQFNLTGYAHAVAALVGSYSDGHASSTVLFGASVVGGNAEIRSVDDGSLFPGCGSCTAQEAEKQLPDPPSLGPCYDGICPEGYYCAKDVGDCDGVGVCLPIPTGCPELDEPVCGCDNRNFANACEAASVGVNVAHVGRCRYGEPADLDGDGVVGGADLALLLGAWGDCQTRGGCNEDIAPAPTGDGTVDGADLAILLGSWTTK